MKSLRTTAVRRTAIAVTTFILCGALALAQETPSLASNPDRDTMTEIIEVHYPGLQKALVREALNVFYELRDVPGLKKKPSTSELLDWIKLLMVEEIPPEALRSKDPTKLIPPLHGALLKNEQDVHLFERLAFLNRRERGGG